MNQIPYYHRSDHFPEDTIVKEKDHAREHTDYYVFFGKTLVRSKRVNRKGRHYQEIRELKENYGDKLKVKRHWNPLDYRIDGYNRSKLSVDTPAKFVEVKRHEAQYARQKKF